MNSGKVENSRKIKANLKKHIKVEMKEINFRDVEEAELNANEMSDSDFKRLVKNIIRDGVLTTAPLLMIQPNKNKYRCISGHHRIRAAIKAGLSKAFCIITNELDESTRIRLQLAHNDIHGEPNENTLAILQQKLKEIDLTLIDFNDVDIKIDEAQEIEYTPPTFRYINICLLEESRESLVDLIESLGKIDAINWIIEKKQYENVTDLLTLAFEKGFKTPGQAFGKFLEIINENKELIER